MSVEARAENAAGDLQWVAEDHSGTDALTTPDVRAILEFVRPSLAVELTVGPVVLAARDAIRAVVSLDTYKHWRVTIEHREDTAVPTETRWVRPDEQTLWDSRRYRYDCDRLLDLIAPLLGIKALA